MGNNVHALLEDIFPDFKYVYSSLFVFDIFFLLFMPVISLCELICSCSVTAQQIPFLFLF